MGSEEQKANGFAPAQSEPDGACSSPLASSYGDSTGH